MAGAQAVGNPDIRYSFGGNSGNNIDCSRYVQLSMQRAGINIGRNTEAQWTDQRGQRVSMNNLQAGDLVFFKDTYSNDHTDGVSHVGIYQGGGKFLNVNDSGYETSSLSNGYWSKHYLGAKRFG